MILYAKLFLTLLFLAAIFGLSACGGGNGGGNLADQQPNGSAEQTAPTETNNDPNSFYQYLIETQGEDYAACVQPIEFELKQLKSPEGEQSGAGKQLNVITALDSSGSMAGQVKGGKKIDLARRAIANFADSLPPEANIALIVYGHRGSSRAVDKAASCAGIETVYPLGKLDRARFDEIVEGVQPAGYTPLARAVKNSGDALALLTGEQFRNVVYVVSDGIETCGGDPVREARSLHNSNTRAVVNIIGFDVDNEAQKQLRAAAEAGGGEFYEARDDAELTEAFRRAAEETRRYVENKVINTQNQNEVSKAMIEAGNEMHACVTEKTNRETSNIQKALSAIPYNDPKVKFRDEVRERYFRERRQKLIEWRDNLAKEIKMLRALEIQKLLDQRAEITGASQNQKE